MVTRDYRYTSKVTAMLKDLNWRPLDQRRIVSRQVLMYKVTYDLVAIPASNYLANNTRQSPGWLGWAMVLGSFQCRGALLLLHIVGQGPAVLAAGAGEVGYIFYIFLLSSLSNALSFGRRLNMTEISWFRLLVRPNGSCQLLPRTS